MTDEPFEFFRISPRGKVHVFDRQVNVVPTGTFMDEFTARLRAKCGALGNTPHLEWETAFKDDDLCRACYLKVPAEDRDRLYDHPTPDGEVE